MSNKSIQKAETLKILGDMTRLRVVHLLATAEKSLCVCEIVDSLNIPQYQVSKILVMLRKAGLVDVDRNGTWGYYHPMVEEGTNKVVFDFVRVYCAGEPFESDTRNLNDRLVLREGDKCVIGFVNSNELKSLMRNKGIETH